MAKKGETPNKRKGLDRHTPHGRVQKNRSGRDGVLVNRSTKSIATEDAGVTPFACWQTHRRRRSQGQATMWSMAVAMVDEDANDLLEMLAVEDQEPIQTLRANRPHEPFRNTVCLRRAKRRANDLYPLALKDPVKTLGELLIPIANQEAERVLARRQRPGQLPGLLRHPRPARSGRAPREMHATSAELDEEQHVEPLQPDCLHGEEIDGEHTLSMRSNEFAPGRASARADRTEAPFPKPCTH